MTKLSLTNFKLIALSASVLFMTGCLEQATSDSEGTSTTPSYPEVTIPVVSAITPSGPADNNNPVLTGTGLAGASVGIFSSSNCSTLVGSGTVDSNGNFSVAVAVPDNSTTTFYTRSATSYDLSDCSTAWGSYQEVSAVSSLVLNTVTPSVPSNNNNVVIVGATTPFASVTLYSNAACTNVLSTSNATLHGTITFNLTVSNNTTTTFYAQTGSSGCVGGNLTYTEDSAPPFLPILSGTTPSSPSNVNSFSINGNAEAGVGIQIFSNAACTTQVGIGTSSFTGTFTIPVLVLNNSTTSFFARATDSAGNASLCTSVPLTYIEDSIAPVAPTLSATTPSGPANNNNPSINGTAEANSLVTLYSDVLFRRGLFELTRNGNGFSGRRF